MIYLYKQGNWVNRIIYDGSILTEKEKATAVVVETLPIKEKRAGYKARLYLDNNNKPYWEYVKIEEEVAE